MIFIYIYIYTHRYICSYTYIHTHTYIHYIYVCVCFKRCLYLVKTWTLTFFLTPSLLPPASSLIPRTHKQKPRQQTDPCRTRMQGAYAFAKHLLLFGKWRRSVCPIKGNAFAPMGLFTPFVAFQESVNSPASASFLCETPRWRLRVIVCKKGARVGKSVQIQAPWQVEQKL